MARSTTSDIIMFLILVAAFATMHLTPITGFWINVVIFVGAFELYSQAANGVVWFMKKLTGHETV